MRVAIGSDHAGFPLKREIGELLRRQGHEVIDVGTNNEEPVDYPDSASALAAAILGGQAERGILICGSGVGACVAVNKIHGIRAGLCHDVYSAHQGVEHDDVNVLCLGARIIGPALAGDLVAAFMAARFSGEERHVRRLEKICELEQRGEPF